ncbi:MAG: hypothetical protein IJZ33_00100 [Clostridia bacterium]|nr:hypothetical protein [Clostridia bacterium]
MVLTDEPCSARRPTADTEEKILISDTWVYDSAGNFEKGTLSVKQLLTIFD